MRVIDLDCIIGIIITILRLKLSVLSRYNQIMNEPLVQHADTPFSQVEFEQQMQERRNMERVLAFCQILDESGDFVGVSFDITEIGICLSLPSTWPQEVPFSLILKRGDSESLPEVKITVNPVWRKVRNEQYDEIGARITAIDCKQDFQSFLHYCQTMGPSGLFMDN